MMMLMEMEMEMVMVGASGGDSHAFQDNGQVNDGDDD